MERNFQLWILCVRIIYRWFSVFFAGCSRLLEVALIDELEHFDDVGLDGVIKSNYKSLNSHSHLRLHENRPIPLSMLSDNAWDLISLCWNFRRSWICFWLLYSYEIFGKICSAVGDILLHNWHNFFIERQNLLIFDLRECSEMFVKLQSVNEILRLDLSAHHHSHCVVKLLLTSQFWMNGTIRRFRNASTCCRLTLWAVTVNFDHISFRILQLMRESNSTKLPVSLDRPRFAQIWNIHWKSRWSQHLFLTNLKMNWVKICQLRFT